MPFASRKASRNARNMARRMQSPIGNFTPKDLAAAMLREAISPVALAQQLRIGKQSFTEMLKGRREINAGVLKWMKETESGKADS